MQRGVDASETAGPLAQTQGGVLETYDVRTRDGSSRSSCGAKVKETMQCKVQMMMRIDMGTTLE
jgi:hypothetical protein